MKGNKTRFAVLSLLVMTSLLGGIALTDTASARNVSTEEANNQNVSTEDNVSTKDTPVNAGNIDDLEGIKNVQVINSVDRDGDGKYSSFEIRVTADTKCYDCPGLDEGGLFGDLDMEPWFEVWINGQFPPSGDFEARSVIVENRDDFTTTLKVNEDFVNKFSQGTANVGIKYWESDTGAETGDDPNPGTINNQLIKPAENVELWGLTQVDIEPARLDENKAPTSSFTFTPNNPTTSDTVTFDASGSSDPDGSIKRYEWDYGDGNTASATGQTVSHSYSSTGTYTVELTVEDDDGATDTTTQTVTVGSGAEATVTSEDVRIPNAGDTGESAITIDADEGVSAADVTVSVDTGVAEITDARKGAGLSVEVDVVDQTTDSVTFKYTDPGASRSSFELGVVEFTARTEGEVADIELSTANFNDANPNPFGSVGTEEGTLSTTTGSLFTGPLIGGFSNPPKNTGELDLTLYEDLDGDGDGTDIGPTVDVFGALIRGEDLGLTDEQARALNWDQESPETEVTVADMIELFGRQIRG